MQPWKNFSYQQPMNPYYQNNYVQPMSMQNPYRDRMNQLQQYQQSLQPPVQQFANQPWAIIGGMVNGFGEVTVNDVFMNGKAVYCQRTGGSELQVQAWSVNVTIQSVVYKSVFEQSQKNLDGLEECENIFRNISNGEMERIWHVTLNNFIQIQ